MTTTQDRLFLFRRLHNKGSENKLNYHRARRRKELAVLETNRMCSRYESECRELGSHFETEEEKAERLKRDECKRKYLETYALHNYN